MSEQPSPIPPPPRRYLEIKERFPEVTAAYEALQRATAGAGPLSGRERELIKFGIALGAGFDSSARAHARKAHALGVTRSELQQAALLAVTTCGWSRAVAALGWIDRALGATTGERAG